MKAVRAQCAFVSFYRRRCGFLATLGAIGLVGAFAAPTGAVAETFSSSEDYGYYDRMDGSYYDRMDGGYRGKHAHKSRGEERGSAKHQTRSYGDGNGNAERHHGKDYGAYDDDYGRSRHGRSHDKGGHDADAGDGSIKPHRANHRAPDGDDRRGTSKQSPDGERGADGHKPSRQIGEADPNDDRRGQQKRERETDRWGRDGRWSKDKQKPAEHVSRGPFGDVPTGPLQIVISINEQKLHLYSDGKHVADAPIATGVPGHPTPMGVFSVIGRERYHESNIYSGAPMPYMQRITWSGVALHQGQNLGHPASHGCIRMSQEFASRLWGLPSLGARVIIARPELIPRAFADPHLFVHTEKPSAPTPVAGSPAGGESVKTAESVDNSTTTDAAIPPLASDGPLRGTIDAASAPDRTRDANDAALVVKPAEPAAAPAKRGNAAVPDVAVRRDGADGRQVDAAATPIVDLPLHVVPLPAAKPSELVRGATAPPIAVFVSRKTSKVYVRRQFAPLFDAPIVIAHPEQPLGTHVFTAMEYLADGSTFRWNLISLPGESSARGRNDDRPQASSGKSRQREQRAVKPVLDPPPETPQGALARIEIPQDVIARISELMVAGSSLVVSDHDLGDETGQGTDFIVVTH